MIQVSLQLSKYQNLEELLRATVAIAIQTLQCDRVIVYSASQTPQAKVLAESVVDQCASVLGKTIKDPFLGSQHSEIYSYGRAIAIDRLDDPQIKIYSYGKTIAIDNFYTANLDQSDRETIDQLEIKSLAFAPIFNDNKLVAVLVAHQCFEPQPWQPEALNSLIEIARAASFALLKGAKSDRANSANLKADKSNQATHQIVSHDRQPAAIIAQNGQNGNGSNLNPEKSIPGQIDNGKQKIESKTKVESIQEKLTQIARKLASLDNSEEILETAVKEIRHLLECDRVVVYQFKQQRSLAIAQSTGADWPKAGDTRTNQALSDEVLPSERWGKVQVWDNLDSDLKDDLEPLADLQVKARVAAPIRLDSDSLFGVLIAHQCASPRDWQPPEINSLTETAAQIGLMLQDKPISNGNNQTESALPTENDENRWNQHFTDAIQYIRQSLNQPDILKSSVKEVRRVIECDRVVIYSLNQDRYGTIIAESVAPGWTKALGRVIDDPCFENKYLQQYRNGRVRAWNDIYQLHSECYVNQLEQLEVKANLVAPIIDQGNLFGLLVCHQCASSRDWQRSEIRWVAQIAMQIGFALENAKLLSDAKVLQQQLEEEKKLTEYFTDAIRYIRQSIQEEDILEVSVEEVRRVLNCDRVLVYSLQQNHDSYAKVIAESVAPGWVRAIGKTMQDPCLEPNYREKYRNGRVRAWDNIYESNLDECHVQQLESIQVQANLVTPIVNENKLFGLLVAQQCDAPRHWQQVEIRWVTQIATQVGFALDNASVLADAKRLQQQLNNESQWTEYLIDAVQYIRQSLKVEDIIKTSVREVRRVIECDRVLIYSLELNHDDYGVVVAESVAPGWTRALGRKIEDPCFEPIYREKYRNGRVRAWNDIAQADIKQCHIDQLENIEVKANLVAPIINEGELFGLLVAHECDAPRDWQQAEIRWIAQIATQIGFALDNAKLMQQLQQSTKTSNQLSHHQQQTDTLKHQIVEILGENGDAYQNLSQQAMRQSQTTIDVLHQIQKVADSVGGIAANVQQAKLQEQQTQLILTDSQQSLDRAVSKVSGIQNTVLDISVGLDNINQACHQLTKAIHFIKELNKQIVQQSMNMTRIINRAEIQANDQAQAIELSDRGFALMQKLFEISARVEPLLGIIQSEVRNQTAALDSRTKSLVVGIGEFQTVQQKLKQVADLNQRMNVLVEKIAEVSETQNQTSGFAKQSVQEVASIAERISEQSMAITQSFNQLIALVQRL